MTVDQALFTSVQNGSRGGYQLAGTSPGVTNAEAKELARWGPAHDSLLTNQQHLGSVNFNVLDSGRICISRTLTCGAEYSGRGGFRIATRSFLLSRDDFERFAFNPFRVLQALVSRRALQGVEEEMGDLKPLSLVGRASLLDPAIVAEDRSFCPLTLVHATNALLTEKNIGLVAGDARADAFLRAVWSLLPPALRIHFPFATGLRHSPRRPYRIVVLPDDGVAKRQLIRRHQIFPFNIRKQVKKSDLRHNAWSKAILPLLVEREKDDLDALLRSASDVEVSNGSFETFLESWCVGV